MTISPLQAAEDVMARAKSLLTHATSASDPLLADDLLRAALAQGVASLDTYLHWAVADVPLSGMSSALKRMEIPFGDLVALSEAVVQNRTKIRPKARARGVLEREIRSQTFQSSRGVEQAMLLLGVRKAFNKIAEEIQPHQAAKEIQDHLNGIVTRRNQIVHEGDLQRQSRPQNIKRENLDQSTVEADLKWLETLIAGIDKVLV